MSSFESLPPLVHSHPKDPHKQEQSRCPACPDSHPEAKQCAHRCSQRKRKQKADISGSLLAHDICAAEKPGIKELPRSSKISGTDCRVVVSSSPSAKYIQLEAGDQGHKGINPEVGNRLWDESHHYQSGQLHPQGISVPMSAQHIILAFD